MKLQVFRVSTLFLLFGLFASSIDLVTSENVLFILPIASKSHKRAYEPLINALAARNHQVTVVSPVKLGKDRENVREIVTNTSIFDRFSDPLKLRAQGTLSMMFQSYDFVFEACQRAYREEEFLSLYKEKFDLVFLNAFMNDPFYGFIYKTGAPYILLTPQAAPTSLTEFVGNVMPSSFVPSAMLPFRDEMSFKERAINFLFNLLLDLYVGATMNHKIEAVYRKELGEDLPSLDVFRRNASMIFTNSHFTQTFPRPLLPDVVEIGGMHCKPAKALPKDLQEFADGAKDGLILFSLGSIVQGNQMPDSTRKVFMNVFSRLKQRVLWKWETEVMSDLPSNVKLSKWVPQQDILGHPNLRLFMTHGGLLSTQEAIYHGSPLLAIPIFGDQNLNAHQAELGGFALTIEILDVTEEDLETKIRELLENKKYAENAKKLSKVFRDQPETPVERAVFWSEYVMRHNGAHHMRSAARKLNMFQYHSIDVFAVLIISLLVILWVVKLATVKIIKVICCRRAKSVEKKNQ
ncbi:unnamed protein product [Allacma fusca]|uniref:UDP-glucuronosyltransferase n=1 Tax=Allacma fusca TaxID=39272 RepID=A0A8J2JH17_9HEXA|nr:unnamed protein product [Allacma fusca]